MSRWILHVDMNSYFASVEQQCNPHLRGKPIAVGGKPGSRSVVAAASREAKKLGVKTAMAAHDAAAICPSIEFVQPNYKKYQAYSERMFGILESFSPQLEIFSIDEAFLQVQPPRDQSVAEWLTGLAKTIKQRFHHELGPVLTASIGVAHNKRLAKLASESQKPDGFTVLLDDHEKHTIKQFRRLGVRAFTRRELFATSDIEDLAGIGPRLGRRLRAASIHTLAHLATQSLSQLETLVFPYHKELYLIGQGKDSSVVVPYWRAKPEQSIGHQYTLPHDVPVIELPATLAWLVERVGRRMRRNEFVAQRLAIYLGRTYAGGWGNHRRTTKLLETDQELYAQSWGLIRSAADDPSSSLEWQTSIRRPGITVSQLVQRTNATQALLPSDEKHYALTRHLDAIRTKYGDRSITSGLSVATHHHIIPDGRRKRFTPTPESQQSSLT